MHVVPVRKKKHFEHHNTERGEWMVNDLGFTINNCKLNFHHQQLQIRLLAFDFPLHICIEEMRNMMKCSYTKEGKKSNHLVQNAVESGRQG